jgi:ATP-dependent helicase HrpB
VSPSANITTSLPVEGLKAELLQQLQQKQTVILTAPTGSGKSTLVPSFLLDGNVAGSRQIYVLQPRRLPARMLARRVASLRGTSLGDEVGYQIRMENKTGPHTRIVFVTEGILLRQILDDPQLQHIGAIILDEFHERHLQSDLALALIHQLQTTSRPDLKLLVMSATLDTEALQQYLGPVPVLHSDGRTFPVEIRYQGDRNGQQTPVWEKALRACVGVMQESHSGDILVFQPGAREIHRTLECLRAHPMTRSCELLPLFGDLPPQDQDRAVLPHPQGKRKIIVATNVAETSLTIDGVTAVVDSGLARVLRYDPRRGINSLLVESISRANADQRAGRAGRTAPGIAIRLWSEREHAHKANHLEPEVDRIDLSETLLHLLAMGIQLQQFAWLTPPHPQRIEKSLQLLRDLGALADSPLQLTAMGKAMSRYPLHPRFSRMLIEARTRNCIHEIADIVALTEGRSLLLPLQHQQQEEERYERLNPPPASDLFLDWAALQYARQQQFQQERCRELAIHAQAAREADLLSRQLLSLSGTSTRIADNDFPSDHIRRCILVGFIDHLAIRENQGTFRCRMIHGLRGSIRKGSCVESYPLIVATDLIEREQKEGVQLLLGGLTAVEEAWLQELYPDDFQQTNLRLFDPASKSVLLRMQTRFRDLVLREKEDFPPADEATATLLAKGILDLKLPLKQWDNSVEQWIERLQFAHHHFPEYGFPTFSTDEDFPFLLEQLCIGCRRYREVLDKPVMAVLMQWCSPEQSAALNTLTPTSFPLPSGRLAPLRYENRDVILSATIQQLYDLTPHPCLGQGRVPIKVELLAPNRRPIQITRDLPAFWTSSYPAIRKELAGRYPKHEWR